MNYKIDDSNENLYTAYLYGEDYCVLFACNYLYEGTVSVFIVVGEDEEFVRSNTNRVLHEARMTGNGSIIPLLHVIKHLEGEFLDFCEKNHIYTISIEPTDEKRRSAYRRLKRYGYVEKNGRFVKSMEPKLPEPIYVPEEVFGSLEDTFDDLPF